MKFTYSPVLDPVLDDIVWQDYLYMIGKRCMPDAAYAAMQEKYPGDYTLQQRYDSEKGGYYYTMEWGNEASKTMWLLKFS